MAEKKIAPGKGKSVQSRDDRLKAALKANMARRKAQARARSEAAPDTADTTGKPER
ncbi:hypothetical protein LCL97_23055 [Seohaeicola saemankumensis]|nr:hypothetical protein [Seohaeicola saemankumensis]MCA0873722.1 hypothetical protein [Seohaeicola saemankumensis]